MAFLFCVTAIQAQSIENSNGHVEAWNGFRLSYDHVFMDVKVEDFVGMNGLNGTNLGYVHALKLGKKVPLFIEIGAGLNFAQGVYKEEHYVTEGGYRGLLKGKDKLTTIGLTIPVNLVYGVKIGNHGAFKPYTGFYLRANFMAKEKVSAQLCAANGDVLMEESEEYNLFDQADVMGNSNIWKRAQVGWQIGLAFDIKKFNFGLGYAIDFNRVQNNIRWSIFSARIGVNF